MKSEKKTVLVGERTNITGSARFGRLIRKGRFDAAVRIGERQVEDGAGMLDICFISSKDERADMRNFLAKAVKKIDTPFMIDSLSEDVLEESLRSVKRRCVINSVNLRNHEHKLGRIAAMALKYNAAVVFNTIDRFADRGMAIKREAKLEIAKRSIALLTEKYRLDPSNIIADPLLFPVSREPEGCKNPAEETVEGLRLIKESFPGINTLIGLSNISFGLPSPARTVLDSVFLHHSELAGLDLAITDPSRLRAYSEIEPSLRRLSEDIIFSGGVGALEKFLDRLSNQ